jgi:signal transduction histidine kinase
VQLEVLDDGPGIPTEAIPHLFDRFFRVDGARSTRGNGSGLGLAIVRWIVQQHGGTVGVASRRARARVHGDPACSTRARRQDGDVAPRWAARRGGSERRDARCGPERRAA